MTPRIFAPAILAGLTLASMSGCGPGDDLPAGSGIPASFQVANEPAALSTVASEPVEGWTGPGGAPFEVASRTSGSNHVYRRIGTETFDLSLRLDEPEVGAFPCTSCHQGRRVSAPRDADAHPGIEAVHPAATGSTCTLCHAPTAVDHLVLQTDETVSLDHAYRLCAQCHYSQTDDWAGGGHGKRLDGWQGRRVVMNCTDCHDPHRPELEPRIPYPGPRIPSADALRPGEDSEAGHEPGADGASP